MTKNLLELINDVAVRGLRFGWGRGDLDAAAALAKPGNAASMALLDRLRKEDTAHLIAFGKAVDALRGAVRGIKSEGDDDMATRRTIRTLEELDALPVKTVVIEDHYEDAYQKIDTDSWMSGEYTVNGPAIALPATVIYEPRGR